MAEEPLDLAAQETGEPDLLDFGLLGCAKHDRELQSYLRRMAGYCLTGYTTEHVFFFLYGTGANGKGTFIDTIIGIWGDYAATAPIETFTESLTDRHTRPSLPDYGACAS